MLHSPITCPPILKSAQEQLLLNTQGYISFPLLEEASCKALQDLYHQKPHQAQTRRIGFSTNMDQQDSQYTLAQQRSILSICEPALSNILGDFQAILATFIIKTRGSHNLTPIHQDWTFVDEEKYCSYTLWIPLHAMGASDGILGLLPGSHTYLANHSRPSPSPPYVPPFREYMLDLYSYLDFIELQAGEALLFDHRTWHGALPNLTRPSRLAIGISLAHKEAELEHHHLFSGGKEMGVYQVDHNFFHTHTNKHLEEMYRAGKSLTGFSLKRRYPFSVPDSCEALFQQIQEEHEKNNEVENWVRELFPPEETASAPETKASTLPSIPPARRKFWQIYTPRNIYLEIRHRLKNSLGLFEDPDFEDIKMCDKPDKDVVSYDHVVAVGAFYDVNHEAFMDTYSSTIQAFRTKQIKDLLDIELAHIGIKKGDVVLDAGCGVCGPALYFSKRVPCEVHAVTISERQYKQAARVIRATDNKNIKLHLRDFHQIASYFDKEQFDRIYFLESLGHSVNKKQLLDACWQVLKPGGIVYIKDLFRRIAPTGMSQEHIDNLIMRINKNYFYEIPDLESLILEARKLGYIIQLAKNFELSSKHFEDLTLSNTFQELTGINETENWNEYIFPVDFLEIRLLKPTIANIESPDKHYLQKVLRQRSKPTNISS